MKKKIITVFLVFVLVFALLWFSDILPAQAAKIAAKSYMKEQLYGEHYKIEYSEYSPAHDSYFVYFSGGPNPEGKIGTTRHVGVYYRYFPFFVWYDSMYPG